MLKLLSTYFETDSAKCLRNINSLDPCNSLLTNEAHFTDEAQKY